MLGRRKKLRLIRQDRRGDSIVKLYVLNRLDLPAAYRSCQAGHAVAEWLLHAPQEQREQWKNGTLIYLGIQDEEELVQWCKKLDRKGIKWIGFREPDLDNQLTAIACLSDGRPFSNLKLLGDE